MTTNLQERNQHESNILTTILSWIHFITQPPSVLDTLLKPAVGRLTRSTNFRSMNTDMKKRPT